MNFLAHLIFFKELNPSRPLNNEHWTWYLAKFSKTPKISFNFFSILLLIFLYSHGDVGEAEGRAVLQDAQGFTIA